MCMVEIFRFFSECGHSVSSRDFEGGDCSCYRLSRNIIHYNDNGYCLTCLLNIKEQVHNIDADLFTRPPWLYKARNMWHRRRVHWDAIDRVKEDLRQNAGQHDWKYYIYFMDPTGRDHPEGAHVVPSETRDALNRMIAPRFLFMKPVQRHLISKEKDVCLMCRGNLKDESNPEYRCGGTEPVSLPCGHFFGRECIEPWLYDFEMSCPACRVRYTGNVRYPYETDHNLPLLGRNRLGLFDDHYPVKVSENWLRTLIFVLLYPIIIIMLSASRRPSWEIIKLLGYGLFPTALYLLYFMMNAWKVMPLVVTLLALLLRVRFFPPANDKNIPWDFPGIMREIMFLNMGPLSLLIPFLAFYRDATVILRGCMVREDLEQNYLEHILSLGLIPYFRSHWTRINWSAPPLSYYLDVPR